MAIIKVGEFARQIPERVGEFRREVALRRYDGYVDGTPVLSGYCRSNWRIGIGTVSLRLTSERVRARAAQRGSVIPRPEAPTLRIPKPGEPILLANLTPYLRRLRRGHSQQSPQDWVPQVNAKVTREHAAIAAEIKQRYEQGGAVRVR